MTPMLLCDALASVLGEALASNHYETESGPKQMKPNVINTFYPPKRSGKADDSPYLYIVPVKGSQSNELSNACEVRLFVGVRSESFDGFNYVFSALEVIKHTLLSNHGQIISHNGMTFRMTWPFSWEYPPEQLYPLWQIGITTNWILPATLGVGDEDF